MLKPITTAALLVVAIIVTAASCTTNPATGKRILNFMPVDQEIRLGSEAAPEFLKEYGGEVPSAEVTRYVRQLGQKLAAESERPDLPWEFHVPNTPVINAFALPGGKVFITRGLMERLQNEAQLAGVLGHEIGHVTAQHINQRMSQAAVVQGGAAVVGGVGAATDNDYLKALGLGTGVVGTGYLLKFSRDQESEADALGVRYMTRLDYNPLGQVQVMRILAEASSGGRPPEFLATHPYPETRISRLNSLINREHPQARGAGNPYTFAKENYERRALTPLKQLPAAPAPRQASTHKGDSSIDFALASHAWCGVCRHDHEHHP
jgi:predicted Zn-dependent protease